MCVHENCMPCSVFPVLVVRLSFGVALCVLVEMFLLEMRKTYQSIRLNILVMTREITEGNNFQEYNKEYRAKRERVMFVKIWQNQLCKTNTEIVRTGSHNTVTGSQQHRQP